MMKVKPNPENKLMLDLIGKNDKSQLFGSSQAKPAGGKGHTGGDDPRLEGPSRDCPRNCEREPTSINATGLSGKAGWGV